MVPGQHPRSWLPAAGVSILPTKVIPNTIILVRFLCISGWIHSPESRSLSAKTALTAKKKNTIR